jgi:iron(III) transport system ATP-binding protein
VRPGFGSSSAQADHEHHRIPVRHENLSNGRGVDALSFTIESGERIVLFGPSGCGKSTTLLLIAGLATPDSGDIAIDGKVVSTARRIFVPPQSRGVGMVFQDLALWPHMSVAENIAFGLRARRVPAAERKRRIGEIANLVGLGDYLNIKPGELSGGEQQRVALARARGVKSAALLDVERFPTMNFNSTQVGIVLARSK